MGGTSVRNICERINEIKSESKVMGGISVGEDFLAKVRETCGRKNEIKK